MESPRLIELLVDLYNDEKNSNSPKSYVLELKKLLNFYGIDTE